MVRESHYIQAVPQTLILLIALPQTWNSFLFQLHVFLTKEWDLYGRDRNAGASWHKWLDEEPVVDFEERAM